MDDLIQYNRERWNALADANYTYSRPFLDLDAAKARVWLDTQGNAPGGLLDNLHGKDVLCLASGGGQQTAVFGLLGANVTVFDLSDAQLDRDQEAAEHYGYLLRRVQGDMRDLSHFENDSFDLVWHPYSINFSPDARVVLQHVARILRLGGHYRLQFANPFVLGADETLWNGRGYPLKHIYTDGDEVIFADPHWDVWQDDGSIQKVIGPREFRHTLSTIVNTLIQNGFLILGLWEDAEQSRPDPNAEPGTWEHYIAVAPPFLRLWASYRPEVFR
jgi:SAM-dependent methyltransferase